MALDIRITPSKAKEILEMETDWDKEFAEEDPSYKEGYIAGMKDFLAILNLTKKDIQGAVKNK